MAPWLACADLSFDAASSEDVFAWSAVADLNGVFGGVGAEEWVHVGRVALVVGFVADGAVGGGGGEGGEGEGGGVVGEEVGDDGFGVVVGHSFVGCGLSGGGSLTCV